MSVIELLRKRYGAGVHINLAEVRNAAGFDASRSCDMLSICTWPSRGLFLRGFEIKTARADWKRELEQPNKAESFAAYCDEWYIVAGDSKVVQLDELPGTWGLLIAKGTRLECAKVAIKNPDPKPITRGLLVAMLKRAVEQNVGDKVIADAKAEAFKSGMQSVERDASKTGQTIERLEENVRKLQQRISDFESASGVPLQWGDAKQIGGAVRLVTHNGVSSYVVQLERIQREIRQIADRMERAIADAKGV